MASFRVHGFCFKYIGFEPMRITAGLFLTIVLGAQEPIQVQFNRQIRPLLSDLCFACHGPDSGNRKSPLRLDREADAKADLGKGRFGIVAGDPGKSGIYQRITSNNKGQRMPPAYAGHDRLPDEQIALIRRWIEEGARYESHYSFIPPQRPAVPAGTQNAIDFFVRARLDREGLKPMPETDRRTLLRRVTLDLTGLPPTPGDIAAFVADARADAYERAVDRLLASTRYAERMAIRWLEAARYADTNGYQSDGPRDMWRWRDWVIDAYNKNMPFDQFTIEQIAGDLLPNATLAQQVATGFHRNHRTSAEGGIVDEEFRVEYVADRAETTSTVWLGLTLGCARCHDHKFDPLAQKDFYSMFAFYNNIPDERGFVWNFGNEPPYIKAPSAAQKAKLDALEDRLTAQRLKMKSLEPAVAKAQAAWAAPDRPWRVNEGLVLDEKASFECVGKCAPFDGQSYLERKEGPKFDNRDPFTFAAWIRPEDGKGAILSRAEDQWEGQQHGLYLVDGKLRVHIVFRWSDLGARVETADLLKLGEWQHVAVTYDGRMRAAGIHLYVNGVEQKKKVLFDNLVWPIDNKFPWRVGAGAGLRFKGEIQETLIYNRALNAEEVSTLPVKGSPAQLRTHKTKAAESKLQMAFLELGLPPDLKRERDSLLALGREHRQLLETVPTVMVMQESDEPRTAYVLKRGAYDQRGEPVKPAIPASLPGWQTEWPKNRLGLARWIVSRQNPLTARVIVNRYWQMLFGNGLVKSVEDFGSQGEWPLHMELLDWLAVEYQENGWDTKALLKTIVTSATYRQSSAMTPALVARDPENRLLARGPRMRISPEMVRDQALAVSGLLVEKVGGPSVKPYQPPGLWQELMGGKGYVQDQGEGLYRRSLYTYWKRTVAPPGMMNFDSPSRELCVVREGRTNTPLQALNLMNDVLYLEAARKLAERMMEADVTPTARLQQAYRLVLGRDPRTQEMTVLQRTLARFENQYRDDPKAAEEFLKQGDSPRDPRHAPAELAAYAAVASLVLNLDEAVTKE